MNKETLTSYINKRIQQNLFPGGEDAATGQQEIYGKSNADLARQEAPRSSTITTASHLNRDNTLSISEKGEILAVAYTKKAESEFSLAEDLNTPELTEAYQREAQQAAKIAQGLSRAARKLQNS
jgi:hypothetical protein